MKTIFPVWTFILLGAGKVLGGVTPPKILYGGWKPILPGHPFYFGPRDNNVPTYAEANDHPYVHQERVPYVEQVIHPTKYAFLPEKVLQNVNHVKKDIFSYYPHIQPNLPSNEMGYKPIYIELPRKPLDIFENPTAQPPSSVRNVPQMHAELLMQNAAHEPNNQAYEQTYLKITPLVDSNGNAIDTENIQIRPYLVPVPPNSPLLAHQNPEQLSLNKIRYHAAQHRHPQQQKQAHYLTDVQYIEQNQIPVNGEAIRYEKQYIEQNQIPMNGDPIRYTEQVAVEIPPHIIDQSTYQSPIANQYTPRSLKPEFDSKYLSIHPNRRKPNRNREQKQHFRFQKPMQQQYPHFQEEPMIYQMENHGNNYKIRNHPTIQHQHQHQKNRKPNFRQVNSIFPSKYHQYQIDGNQEQGHQQLYLENQSGGYIPMQNTDRDHPIRMHHHKGKVSPGIAYKEVASPKPIIYHVQQSDNQYGSVGAEVEKQIAGTGDGDLAIIHIPLAEYLRLKAHENLIRKDALIVSPRPTHDMEHQSNPNDYYLTQHSSNNPRYEENGEPSKEIREYRNPDVEFTENQNITTAHSNEEGKPQNENEDQQIFHAYYAPVDHDPPEGYVKMSIKEFSRMFKNAEIRYVDKYSNGTSTDDNNINTTND